MHKLISIVYLLIIVVFCHQIYGGEQDKQIMTAGTFHGDEVTAENGEEWDVLYWKDGRFILEQFPIKLEIVEDVIMDENGEKTGKMVSVPVEGEPVLLLKNFSNLTAGEIATSMDHRLYFFEKDHFNLKTGGKEYELKMRREGSQAELIYSDAATEQVIKKFTITKGYYSDYNYGDGGMPSIIWSGDLDGDNIPDLLLDISDKYNLSEIVLYLSSHASNGELVKKVAEFRTVGC